MKYTTLKRFEFSSSRQLAAGRIHGNNFAGWAGVSGGIDSQTGMMINIVDLKKALNQVLDRFDHRSLNAALYPTEPSTLNVARAIAEDLAIELPEQVTFQSLFLEEIEDNAVQLHVSPTGQLQAEFTLRDRFSAAHRTHAPRLDLNQNQALYGRCNNPAGHGHNYQVELSLDPALPIDPLAWPALWETLDHSNLSQDLVDFRDRNVVTETIASYISEQLLGRLPLQRIRVWETPDFYAEYHPPIDRYRLGRRYRFHAAHRLESRYLSSAENQQIFGKCNRLEPHGHTYIVQVSVNGKLDPLTDTAYDLNCLDQVSQAILGKLDYTYLDQEIAYFNDHPSTGENIAAYLWKHFAENLPQPSGEASLDEIRVWETPNNQFIVSR